MLRNSDCTRSITATSSAISILRTQDQNNNFHLEFSRSKLVLSAISIFSILSLQDFQCVEIKRVGLATSVTHGDEQRLIATGTFNLKSRNCKSEDKNMGSGPCLRYT